MKNRQLKAVIFDVDGVLCDTDELHYQSWKHAVRMYDIPFDREINHRLRGLNREQSLNELLGEKRIASYDFQKILEAKNNEYAKSLSTLGPQNLAPCVLELLDNLRRKDLKIGVASASEHAYQVLNQLGILPRMNYVCDAQAVERSKPAPDPYLLVSNKLGVDPITCVVIEDSQAGILSAQSAGMCVIGIGAATKSAGPDFACNSLCDLGINALQNIHSAWYEQKCGVKESQ